MPGGCALTANESVRGASQRADAAALDSGAERIGDADAEDQIVGRGQFGEGDDVLPDHLGRRVDLH
jgi:hypothetical protein